MKISIIIPVYNAEEFISKAVESALQFEEVFEVILIEDKSPDNALQVCQGLAAKYDRVKLYQHTDKQNHGASASRNFGIEKSTGDFIAFLDADDYYLPNRFDAEKELFKNPQVDGVYGALGVYYYTEKAIEKYYHIFEDKLCTVYKKCDPRDVFFGLCYMLGSFGMFSIDTLTIRKKSLIEKVSVFFKHDMVLHEDTEFFLRLSYYLDLHSGIIDKAVAMRGVHENNRITKVETRIINPAKSRSLLWCEIYQWAEKENIPEEVRVHIKRIYRSYEIAKAPTIKKWGMIAKYLLIDYKSIRSGLYNINFRHTLF